MPATASNSLRREKQAVIWVVGKNLQSFFFFFFYIEIGKQNNFQSGQDLPEATVKLNNQRCGRKNSIELLNISCFYCLTSTYMNSIAISDFVQRCDFI